MEFSTFLWTTFASFVTLAIFSFLYKDNPFYKFAEHLVVGVSAGYFVVILWHNGLIPNLFQRLADGHWYAFWLDSTSPWYVIPALLGCLMWTRFSKEYSWISRWPMALYIGISVGVAIPLEMSNRVNKQLYAIMSNIDWGNFFGAGGFDLLNTTSGLSQLIIFTGAIAALIYFYFSKPHTGWFGGIANYGIWILMIGFGASFGFTVMARISLFIQRIQSIDGWRSAAFDTTNPNFSAWFQVFFWLLSLVAIGYIVYEFVTFLRRRGSQA